MMGDEFVQQRLRRRPGEGAAGGGQRLGLGIAEVGDERPQRIVAQAFAGEMLERGDIVIGQKAGELVAAVERQDGVERVEFRGAAKDRVLVSRLGTVCRGQVNSGWFDFLAVLTRMPQPQHIQGRLLDFIAQLVLANENTADLPRLELLEPLAKTRLLEQACCGGCQRLHGPGRGLPIDRSEKIVKAADVRDRLARPLQLHQRGSESGLSLSRLSAQAWTD